MAALARERAPRFMDADLDILVEEVENRRKILYARGPRKPFRTEMKYQWEEVARKINAQSDAPRTWSQCRKKFNDLTRVVKEKIARNRQQQKQSGGAPARAQRLSRLEERVLAIMRSDATHPVAAGGLEIIDNDDTQDIPPGFAQADELQESEEEEEDTPSLHLSLPSTSSDPGTSRTLEDSLEARSTRGESPGTCGRQPGQGGRVAQAPASRRARSYTSSAPEDSDEDFDGAAYRRRLMRMHVDMLGALSDLPESLREMSRSMGESSSNLAHVFARSLEPILSSMEVVASSMSTLADPTTMQCLMTEVSASIAAQAEATQRLSAAVEAQTAASQAQTAAIMALDSTVGRGFEAVKALLRSADC